MCIKGDNNVIIQDIRMQHNLTENGLTLKQLLDQMKLVKYVGRK